MDETGTVTEQPKVCVRIVAACAQNTLNQRFDEWLCDTSRGWNLPRIPLDETITSSPAFRSWLGHPQRGVQPATDWHITAILLLMPQRERAYRPREPYRYLVSALLVMANQRDGTETTCSTNRADDDGDLVAVIKVDPIDDASLFVTVAPEVPFIQPAVDALVRAILRRWPNSRVEGEDYKPTDHIPDETIPLLLTALRCGQKYKPNCTFITRFKKAMQAQDGEYPDRIIRLGHIVNAEGLGSERTIERHLHNHGYTGRFPPPRHLWAAEDERIR
jgi:hypothetical protein